MNQNKQATKNPGVSKGIRVDSVCERSVKRVRRILNPENIKKALKRVQTLGNVFKKPKDGRQKNS